MARLFQLLLYFPGQNSPVRTHHMTAQFGSPEHNYTDPLVVGYMMVLTGREREGLLEILGHPLFSNHYRGISVLRISEVPGYQLNISLMSPTKQKSM